MVVDKPKYKKLHIWNGDLIHEVCVLHRNNKDEVRGRSRHQYNSNRVVRNMKGKIVGTIRGKIVGTIRGKIPNKS